MANKTIFITGTSTGLGRLTAIHFARLGWNVAATMRTPEQKKELQQYENVKLFKLDVTKVDQVQSAADQAIAAFGRIDVVVNNAGMGTYGPLELAEEKDIDWQFAVNTRGPINIIRKFVPHFRANGGGMFINISSFMGVTTAVPLGSLYNMSKFALEGLIEGLYYELKPQNIELRLIEQGGSTGNNFQNNMVWNRDPNVDVYDEMIGKVSGMMQHADSSRLDDPQTIVDAIAALATGESSRFRTVIGEDGNRLLAMRNSVPIEQYLEAIAQGYK
ncbi:SDR family oxidoreductase [Paenibacillus jilunlii]|uniref:Short-chain dehydrogenase n=1 Tax=Paenibacillus jilunlii TaxID=682956 RepID=A0A1G9KWZ2_9BACL|nr:SDR family oxidoreductase [Paenibacillus jilunlii]KWX69809.1 short-chain dehydrogenase [Paenibacillus jilunlii]SDL53977.1 short chain dehydrogenase [Paenibacillus jilunlii]